MTPRAELCTNQEKTNRGAEDYCVVPRVECWGYRSWSGSEREGRVSLRKQASGVEPIETAVNSSHWIHQLGPDWDSEGSQGYDKAVWDRATNFVLAHAKALWEAYGSRMDVPRILPGPKGSIDVHWKTPRYELLINFPAGQNEMASFYGDDYDKAVVRGTLNPEKTNPGVLVWLRQQL